MNIDEVVLQLKEQRSQLDAAIQALQGTEGHGKRGRPRGRTMSAATRKRISQMMKKRFGGTKESKEVGGVPGHRGGPSRSPATRL